jgi:hypothetical protein
MTTEAFDQFAARLQSALQAEAFEDGLLKELESLTDDQLAAAFAALRATFMRDPETKATTFVHVETIDGDGPAFDIEPERGSDGLIESAIIRPVNYRLQEAN